MSAPIATGSSRAVSESSRPDWLPDIIPIGKSPPPPPPSRMRAPLLPSIPEVDESSYSSKDDSPEAIQAAMDRWQQTIYNERMRMYAEEAKRKMFSKVKDG